MRTVLAGDGGARGSSSGELASRGGGLLREPARRTTAHPPSALKAARSCQGRPEQGAVHERERGLQNRRGGDPQVQLPSALLLRVQLCSCMLSLPSNTIPSPKVLYSGRSRSRMADNLGWLTTVHQLTSQTLPF